MAPVLVAEAEREGVVVGACKGTAKRRREQAKRSQWQREEVTRRLALAMRAHHTFAGCGNAQPPEEGETRRMLKLVALVGTLQEELESLRCEVRQLVGNAAAFAATGATSSAAGGGEEAASAAGTGVLGAPAAVRAGAVHAAVAGGKGVSRDAGAAGTGHAGAPEAVGAGSLLSGAGGATSTAQTNNDEFSGQQLAFSKPRVEAEQAKNNKNPESDEKSPSGDVHMGVLANTGLTEHSGRVAAAPGAGYRFEAEAWYKLVPTSARLLVTALRTKGFGEKAVESALSSTRWRPPKAAKFKGDLERLREAAWMGTG